MHALFIFFLYVVLISACLPDLLSVTRFGTEYATGPDVVVVCAQHPLEQETAAEFCRKLVAVARNQTPRLFSLTVITLHHPANLVRLNAFGVDLNRNWPAPPPCEPSYPWPYDPHTQRITEELLAALRPPELLLTVHAGADVRALITPYDCGAALPAVKRDELRRVAQTLVPPHYAIGTAAEVLGYNATGTLVDYAHGVLGVSLAYTLELPLGEYSEAAAVAEYMHEALSLAYARYATLK